MIRFLVVILLVAACVPAAAQNLVANGSFESPDYYDLGYMGIAPGPYLDGWTVDADSVDVIGSLWPAAAGRQSIDLSGNHPGAVWQDITTVTGTSYTLSFAMAGNPQISSVKTMEVWWGDTKLDTLQFDTAGHSIWDMGWAYHSYTVTGSGTDRLRFVSAGINDCYGPTLDDVSVTQAPVPEPSSLLALLSGMGILIPALRRRRQ